MKTSIIIVNHNTTKVLIDCVKSIFKYENPEEFDIKIVDNASNEDCLNLIGEISNEHKNIDAIYLKDLMSFSYANNMGIKDSKGEYIIIMNPDIIFESPLINKLITIVKYGNNIGAVAPALVGTDGKLQQFYYQRYPSIKQFIFFHSIILRLFYKKSFFINRYWIDERINLQYKKQFFVNHIPGAFFVIPRKILDDVGLMDENFILFFEDTDLSYRINKKYKLIVDTSLQVKHLGGTSFKEMQWWVYGRFNVSMIYFVKKHYSKLNYLTLKYLAIYNAYCMLFIENILKLTGKKDEFRIKKYKNFLKLVKEV